MSEPAVDEAVDQTEADSAPPGGGGLKQLVVHAHKCHTEGKWQEAADTYSRAAVIAPQNAELRLRLGVALVNLKRAGDAEAAFRAAIRLKPELIGAYLELGNMFRAGGRLEDAIEAYGTALERAPDTAGLHNNIGGAYANQGRLADAMAAYRRAAELDPDYPQAQSNLVACMNYDGTIDPAEIGRQSAAFGARRVELAGPPAPFANPPEPDRRLRVGYVSPDLRRHSVSYFFEPLLREHAAEEVAAYCYAEVSQPDETTERLRGMAAGWRSTIGIDDDTVAAAIREDGIDILVDLAGHTPKNRLGVFARRPAPVQVTWLGYPFTTGLPTVDYRLTDRVADPPGPADAHYSETLERLPDGFHCFQPAADAPPVTAPPARANGHVTFCSFNNLPKVVPEVLDAWAAVLRAVPDAQLIVKTRPFADDATRRRVLAMLQRRGVAESRLKLLPRIPAAKSHLALYGKADIALDTFPYNGTTTTCEAMWMGVPVITLTADRAAGRVGASLLTQVGLTELIAPDVQTYVSLARDLAGDLDRLAALRRGLRERMAASPLCDPPGFARHVEAAYRRMWRTWCAGADGGDGG